VFAKPWDEGELVDRVEEALLSPSGVVRAGGEEQVGTR
jgi:hypothetical protein